MRGPAVAADNDKAYHSREIAADDIRPPSPSGPPAP